MAGNVQNFYASGNTARGFVCLYESSLQGLKQLYVLLNGIGAGKSDLLRSIGQHYVQRGLEVWYLHSAAVSGAVNGLIVPEAKVGILDETGPRAIRYDKPDAERIVIDFAEACDADELRHNQADIAALRGQMSDAYEQAYAGFAEALAIHDDWEKVYISSMDLDAANALTDEYIHRLCGDQPGHARTAREDHRFLGAATPGGAVDFIPELTAGLKRYYLKGRPGTGKSTMLKRIAREALHRGYDTEMYHCGFDPGSLDMVIVRELGFAVFDSTAPHEYFPEHSGDEVIDMYARCVKPGTDERYADVLQQFKTEYSARMKQSIQHLAEAKSKYDRLVQIYAQATDFIACDLLKKQLAQALP